MEHTKKISRKTKREHKTLTGWLFIAPAFICFLLFLLIPAIMVSGYLFFAVAVEYLSVCFNVRPKRRDSFLPSGCIAESEGSGYSRFPRAVLSAVPYVYSGVFHGVEMAEESAGRVAQHAAFSCWASHLRLAQ